MFLRLLISLNNENQPDSYSYNSIKEIPGTSDAIHMLLTTR